MSIAIKEITEQDKQLFEEFLKTEAKPLHRLKYTLLPEPHYEIAVLVAQPDEIKRIELAWKQFAEQHKFVLSKFGNNILTISKIPFAQSADGTDYIFSGFALHNGKMLWGMDEVVQNITGVNELNENYGEFSLLTIKNGTLHLSADFFGMAQWFYYDIGDIFAACNNYHLLLLLMSAGGINISMNVRHSCVNLITTGFIFGTPFNTDLDVNGCKLNLPYEKLSFEQGKRLKINKTSLYDIISTVEDWNEDLYEDYLFKAKEEIYNNVRAIFEHERFKTVVVDLSGGFDSRIVYATACNLPKRLRQKMKIYSRGSHLLDDKQCAFGVQNIYEYKRVNFHNSDISDLFDERGFVELAQVSRSIGTYAIFTPHIKEFTMDDIINITGGCGGILLGFKRVSGWHDFSDEERLINQFGNSYLWTSSLKEVYSDKNMYLKDTLNMFNCDDLSKKLQLLYLCFRNRFHFKGTTVPAFKPMLFCNVLFSKGALKAKWMYFNKFKNNAIPDEKICLDLTAMINPLLALIPYASENDNVLPKKENLLNPVTIELILDQTEKTPILINERAKEKTYDNKARQYMDDLTIAKEMLRSIYKYSKNYADIVVGLYKLLCMFEYDSESFKQSRAKSFIRNIYDCYYQIDICRDNGDI